MAVTWTAIGLLAATLVGAFATTISGFSALNGRIDSLGGSLGGRIDSLDAKIDGLGARLDARIDGLEVRFDRLDSKIDGGLSVRLEDHIPGHRHTG